MSVVDLSTGRPISAEPKKPPLVEALQGLIERINNGTLELETFYLIAEADGGKERYSFDNGLTGSEVITMLEREKFRILCMIEGVNL